MLRATVRNIDKVKPVRTFGDKGEWKTRPVGPGILRSHGLGTAPGLCLDEPPEGVRHTLC